MHVVHAKQGIEEEGKKKSTKLLLRAITFFFCVESYSKSYMVKNRNIFNQSH